MFLLLLSLAQIVPDGAEDEGGEHANVPQDKEEPEGVIQSGAFGPVSKVGVHRGEEGLRKTGAFRQGDVSRDGRRHDPSDEGKDDDDGVQIELDTLRDFKLHARRRLESGRLNGSGSDTRRHKYYTII